MKDSLIFSLSSWAKTDANVQALNIIDFFEFLVPE